MDNSTKQIVLDALEALNRRTPEPLQPFADIYAAAVADLTVTQLDTLVARLTESGDVLGTLRDTFTLGQLANENENLAKLAKVMAEAEAAIRTLHAQAVDTALRIALKALVGAVLAA